MDECNCGHVCLHLVLKAATILGEQHEPAQERGRHEPGRQDRCAFASTAHHPREICASEAWLSHIAGDVVANPHVTDCACKDWTPRGEDLETVIDAARRSSRFHHLREAFGVRKCRKTCGSELREDAKKFSNSLSRTSGVFTLATLPICNR